MWYLKCLLIEDSQLDICMLITYVTLSVICKTFGSDRPQTSYLSICLSKIGKYLCEKLVFLLYFVWLVIFFELCAFNREEDVVFGYVHFINTECCILSIRTHGSHLTFV